ncbi:hypothetical protein KC19_9G045100 [Ceratodon purpureus]|uniref:Uncharacterized protein n=1 Tax=Ceratodon purpureus TaxID=3225 RepID=A0A8T0GRZ5_CERPU|nr:hypothetical protein KC19_9G045100 [Ceratodon purpureus]
MSTAPSSSPPSRRASWFTLPYSMTSSHRKAVHELRYHIPRLLLSQKHFRRLLVTIVLQLPTPHLGWSCKSLGRGYFVGLPCFCSTGHLSARVWLTLGFTSRPVNEVLGL